MRSENAYYKRKQRFIAHQERGNSNKTAVILQMKFFGYFCKIHLNIIFNYL